MQDAPLRDRVTQYADALYPDMQILAPTWWGMRQARQTLLTHLNGKGFERYPDKTQVGRLFRTRFDWLGWDFTPDGICPVPRAGQYYQEKRCTRSRYPGAKGCAEDEIHHHLQRCSGRKVITGSAMTTGRFFKHTSATLCAAGRNIPTGRGKN